ncbi:uncharacterized protein PAC_13287 [Phialocephala subalpina]|uniref:Uncharacterized protein n=1 Tax=Phialocephala subalpina TaxID=576137 RepID=A0A1L7XEB7_9HELO|nr:uncharacterized protein PAC_13287 [Phialocephala subalpina]
MPAASQSKALQPKSTNVLKRPHNEKKGKGKNPVGGGIVGCGGKYKITQADTHGELDISSFSFKLFHLKEDHNNYQLFAKFTFGDIQGIMRSCPHGTLNSAPDQGLTIEEFDCACRLTQTTKPGPKNDAYLMMWRGKAGGMRLELEYNWGDLWNLDWGEISETLELEWAIESESELDSESEAHVDSEGDLGGEQPQVPIGRAKKILKTIPDPSISKFVELPPQWAYDITAIGRLRVLIWICGLSAEVHVSLNKISGPAHTFSQRFIAFTHRRADMGNTGEPAARSPEEFEEACVLENGCWPSPEPKGREEWQSRWRGFDGYKLATLADVMDGYIQFKMEDWKLTFSGSFMRGATSTIISAEKIGDVPPQKYWWKDDDSTVTDSWDLWGRRKDFLRTSDSSTLSNARSSSKRASGSGATRHIEKSAVERGNKALQTLSARKSLREEIVADFLGHGEPSKGHGPSPQAVAPEPILAPSQAEGSRRPFNLIKERSN